MNIEEARRIVATQDTTDPIQTLDAIATILRLYGIVDAKQIRIAEEIESVSAALREKSHMTDTAGMTWTRYRFKANGDDYRPVKFPPPGPYWCTGSALDSSYSIVVAYLPEGTTLTDWWPEADEVEEEARSEITFTDRFPKPQWWTV